LIRQQLGMAYLSTEGVLSMVHNAMLKGHRQVILWNGDYFLTLTHHHMKFTVSFDCSTVIAIQYETSASPLPVAPLPVTPTPSETMNQHFQYKANDVTQRTSPTPPVPKDVPHVAVSSTFEEKTVDGVPTTAPCDDCHDFDEIEEMENYINADITSNYRLGTPVSSVPSQTAGSTAHLSKNGVSMIGPAPTLVCIPSAEEINHSGYDVSPVPLPVTVPADLSKELLFRFNGQWQSASHLAQCVHHVITTYPMTTCVEAQCGDRLLSWRVWLISSYVFVMEMDGCTVAGIFEENLFREQYQNCILSLAQRHFQGLPSRSPSYSNVESTASVRSSISLSRSPSLTAEPASNSTAYHLIYIKPIMERLVKLTGNRNIDQMTVTKIVDAAIQCGEKRQISKRTFEFKWGNYTVIMSKSMRTILDVTISEAAINDDSGDVITVHPDVVSILAKKCPTLDYFKIQKLAHGAKETARFSAKKNEYRQQFTYEYAGCRIVFASNHSTIVEMQCYDPSALRMSASVTRQ